MVRMFFRHEVADYAAWRSVYDSIDDSRASMGVTGQGVFRFGGRAETHLQGAQVPVIVDQPGALDVGAVGGNDRASALELMQCFRKLTQLVFSVTQDL